MVLLLDVQISALLLCTELCRRERPQSLAPMACSSVLQDASAAKSAQPLDLSSLRASMPKTDSYVRLAGGSEIHQVVQLTILATS